MPDRRNINIGSEFPGTWTDAEGGIHFDVPAIHKLLGLPDSEEDRRETILILAATMKDRLPPGCKIVLRMSPEQ